MNANKDSLTRLEILRARANKRIKKNCEQDFSQLSPMVLSPMDIARLVHELETHQLELEMQNEEMQAVQDDLLIVRDQYTSLYDFAPVGYLTVSEKGIILKTNLTFSDMLEVAKSNLNRQLFSAFVIKEDQSSYYRFLRALLASEKKQSCQLRLSAQAKNPFWVSLEGTLNKSALNQSACVAARQFHMIVIDINEQKQNEIKQAQLQREVQQINKMATIGQLTGGIAHDFNNILGIIMGYTELARLNAIKNAETQLDYQLRQILDASERGKDLIASMMTFSYQSKDNVIPLDLKTELEELITLLKPIIPSSIISKINIQADLPKVLMDKVKLNQLVMNLVINARDSMGEQGELAIQLNWQKELNHECANCHKQITGDWIQLSVTDTGTGILTEDLSRIFDPFYSNKKIGKGTGLGLAIVAGLIHGLGGHVLVSTELNKGTSFQILFPPVLNFQQETNNFTVKQPDSLQGHGEQILIIDDELSLASCIGELLEGNGYKTIVYDNSNNALAYFLQNPQIFDLVLTDQTMPDLTGIEIASQIRELRPELPIILSSGNFDTIDLEFAKKLNVFLLAKPAPTKELYQAIKNLLPSPSA